MVSCAREGHVRLAELSSTGTCKTTRKLAQHHGAAHKVSVFRVHYELSYRLVDRCSVCELWSETVLLSSLSALSVQPISNELTHYREERRMLNTVWQWKHRWLWHVLRNEVLLWDIIEGRMNGKVYCGRKRLHMLSDVASSAKYLEVKRAAEDREGWRAKIKGEFIYIFIIICPIH